MGRYAARSMAYFLSAALLGYAFVTAWSVQCQLREARAVLAERTDTAERLRRENAALEADLLQRDERENLERIARSRLGLVYPNEKVIYFIGD